MNMIALVLLTQFGSDDICEKFLLFETLYLLKKRGHRTTLSFHRKKKLLYVEGTARRMGNLAPQKSQA